jgi:hypothetical protein
VEAPCVQFLLFPVQAASAQGRILEPHAFEFWKGLLSHGIGTPLTSLLGYVEWLSHEKAASQRQTALDAIHDSAREIQQLHQQAMNLLSVAEEVESSFQLGYFCHAFFARHPELLKGGDPLPDAPIRFIHGKYHALMFALAGLAKTCKAHGVQMHISTPGQWQVLLAGGQHSASSPISAAGELKVWRGLEEEVYRYVLATHSVSLHQDSQGIWLNFPTWRVVG